jgi:hypothetical protein
MTVNMPIYEVGSLIESASIELTAADSSLLSPEGRGEADPRRLHHPSACYHRMYLDPYSGAIKRDITACSFHCPNPYPVRTALHTTPYSDSFASNLTEQFTTPSFFVHVRFISHDATDHSYFVAGKPRTTALNRIIAHVRTSSSRTKKDFDDFAENIEDAWRAAIYGDMIEEGSNKGKRQKEVDESERDAHARKLLAVAFVPMVAVREAGMTIPEAGQEGQWFKDNMEHFQKMVDEKGDEDYEDMLRELEERDDLKKLVGGGGISGMLKNLSVGGQKSEATTDGEEKKG